MKPPCPTCQSTLVFLYSDYLWNGHSSTEDWQCWSCGQIFTAPKPPRPPYKWTGLKTVKPLAWRLVETPGDISSDEA